MIRAELKNEAKEQIKGNIGQYFLCGLITIVLGVALSSIPVAGPFLNMFFMAPISVGFAKLNLGMARGEKVTVSGLFSGFNQFGTAVLAKFLAGLFTMLWSLLLIIPGIIKAISYSMTDMIIADNPDMTALEAINESKEIMNGHKWELFVLSLSFILWVLLGVVTFGLAYIYVAPYYNMTITNFYNKIKVESSDDFMSIEE